MIHPAIQQLFEYSAAVVTDNDIRNCPSDPGYPDYCRAMTQIRDSLKIPQKSNFDIRETIALTGWTTQQDQSFLRFRRFTGATALGLEYQLALEGYSNGEIRSSYHLCHELLTDCDLTDQKYVVLLIKAFQTCQHAYTANVCEVIDEEPADPEDSFEYQYVCESWIYYALGTIYLAQHLQDWKQSEHFATDVIQCLKMEYGEFDQATDFAEIIQSLTQSQYPGPEYPSLHRKWKLLLQQISNPNDHADTAIIMSALKNLNG